ncbi:MAG TPA: alpha/beta fold hydrolase [Candidatus Thiothrix moscowensis]|uniref:alpha/beta fold hydrolase n=1 Tax=unclassified Thiothrix TaxID=2636184 RepID=UPI0025FE7E14|nr:MULTISPECIES: alpha/beta fold hydrolase [unclassified Thiothrix]HRJ51334.1 alpha/beta fold hydrolase [Candidatus Thiothrix moscowensis]HRJ91611.1 alpha/beta fold hydrolase [Candidatus Thiothrix moscowensis]
MLNYRLYGELTETPPLVVLHGLLGSLENWYTFARGQADKRCVLAIDLRNHGASPHLPGMAYRDMAADVVEVLDALGIYTCDLMGHSMGGKVAMILALHYPALIRHLLVVDIAPKAYPPRHQALLQAMATMPLANISSRKQADEWLAATVKQPFERGFLLKNLGRATDGTFFWQCNLAEIARHYLKISSFPAFDIATHMPALFIDGGQSDYVQDEDMPLIRQYFPLAERVTVEAAGHLPHVQTPVEFTALVESFLDQPSIRR